MQRKCQRCCKSSNAHTTLDRAYLSAAWQIVPHVSAMSSTRMATRSFTSPTRTMRSTSFAFFLSLWMRAKSTFNLSAMEVTLQSKRSPVRASLPRQMCQTTSRGNNKTAQDHWEMVPEYLLAPPASGETIVHVFQSGIFSLIHFSTAGSAYKLSTGISKNPWEKTLRSYKKACACYQNQAQIH